MASPASIRRDDAARLLGVRADADTATVRRAFRAWASLMHPDHGGDPKAFAELCRARDILLATRELPEPPGPRPRRAWSDVLSRPDPVLAVLLGVGGVLAVLSVMAGVWVAMPWGVVPPSLLAAGWCCAAASAVVRHGDVGHVIVARSVAWAVMASAQVVVATVLGIAIVGVLPLLALPFVTVIAAVNPGAGLWRAGRPG